MRSSTASILFVPILLGLAAPGANADCALGAAYLISSAGASGPNSVTICVSTSNCGGPQTMLRQDAATGAIVQLPNFCDASDCYVDECVPAGTYRYGYATPFTCADKACGDSVPYFATATVSATGISCTRSAADPGPTAYTSASPWGTGTLQDISCGGSGCATSDLGLSTNVAALDACAIVAALLWFRMRKHAR
jgi:hypothetical protein